MSSSGEVPQRHGKNMVLLCQDDSGRLNISIELPAGAVSRSELAIECAACKGSTFKGSTFKTLEVSFRHFAVKAWAEDEPVSVMSLECCLEVVKVRAELGPLIACTISCSRTAVAVMAARVRSRP